MMRLTIYILLTAALALAAPTNHLRKRTFAVSAKGFVDQSKAVARAHRKWGMPAVDLSANAANKVIVTHTITEFVTPQATSPTYVNSTSASPTAADASSTTGTGEVTASPETNDIEYLSPVSIGGQTLDLDFDTGSADLWVFSTSLSASEIGNHTVFNPAKSSTWTNYTGASWSILYGDGSEALGTVGYDTVDIGGVSATHQCVELATNVSSEFTEDTESDGLLGLGFSVANTVKPVAQKTFWETVMDSLDEPLFTADLDENAAGTYEFGTIDSSKYTGNISWVSVNSSNGYWEFDSPAYGVGSSTTACSTCSPAIADTGTSLMMMDTAVVKAYYAQVETASYSTEIGGWIYSCNTTLPTFSVAIGPSAMATIDGDDLTYLEYDDGTCYGGLQNGPGSIQVLGDVFLKSYFTIFDGGATRLGVAKKA